MKQWRMRSTALSLLPIFIASCNTQGPPGGPPIQRIVADYARFPIQPFVIDISADRTTGVVGTTFVLTAAVQGAAEPLQIFEWQADNETTSTQPQFSVSFDQPGHHTVRLAVRDAQGRDSTRDILLTVFDPAAAPASVPSTIQPTAGYPGTIVQITSSNLLSAGGVATMRVGGSAGIETYRPLLGQASFVIPLNAADGLAAQSSISIQLLINGQVVEAFPFVISPLPVVSSPPGELTRSALADIIAVADDLAVRLPEAFKNQGLDAEELAVLLGLVSAGADTLATVRDEVGPLLDQMNPDSLAMLDRLGAANGLIEAVDRLKQYRQRAKVGGRAARTPGDDLLDTVAALADAREVLKQVSNAVQYAAWVFNAFGIFTGGAAPVALSYAAVLSSVGNALDLVDMVMELIPKIQDQLDVSPDPTTVEGDGFSNVEVRARLVFSYDPCAKLTETILAELAARFAQRLLQKYPPGPWASMAYQNMPADARQEMARQLQPFATWNPLPTYHGMPNPPRPDNYPLPLQRLIAEFLEKQVEKYAHAVTKLARIDTIFDKIFQKACHFNFDYYRPLLGSDTYQMTVDPPSVGTLTFNPTNAVFRCSTEHGAAILRAERKVGKMPERTLRGQANIRCGDTCEEGLGYLATNSVDTQVNCNSGGCVGNHEFTLRNMHPDRYLVVCVMEDAENVTTGGHFYHVDVSTVPPNGTIGPFLLNQCWVSAPDGSVSAKTTHIIQAFVGCPPSGPDPQCSDSIGNDVTLACKQELIDQWIRGSHTPLADFATRVYPPCSP